MQELKSFKFLEESLTDYKLGKYFENMAQKGQGTKENIIKLYFMEL
jgi:hypothetical protein